MVDFGEVDAMNETVARRNLPCFRMATTLEVEILERSGVLTRAMQDREDWLSSNRRREKLENILFEYLERHTPNSQGARELLKEQLEQTEFIARGLSLVSGLQPDNEIIKKIAAGEASASETRIFFATFTSKRFNIAAQASGTTPYSSLFSVTYGGVLNTHIPDDCVLLELEIPFEDIIVDETVRNSMENELFTDRIESAWVVGRHKTSKDVVNMLKRRKDLPVQIYLQGIDLDNEDEVDDALHQSKRVLIESLIESGLIPSNN